MDKKGTIAIALAIIVMVVWQIKFAPKLMPPPAASSPAPSASASPVAPELAGNATPEKTAIATAPEPGPQTEPEALQTVSTADVNYIFTNLGGGIARAELSKYPAEEGNVTMNEFGSLPIGAISEQANPATMTAAYMVTSAKDGEIMCERTGSNGVQISKKFTLPKGDAGNYSVTLDVTFTNRGAQPWNPGGYFVSVGSAAPIHQRDLPLYTGFDSYRNGKAKYIDVNWFSAGHLPLVGIQTRPERPSYSETVDNIAWAGVKSQYFTTIIVPAQTKGTSVWAQRFPVDLERKPLGVGGLKGTTNTSNWFAVEGAIGLPGFSLAPGGTHNEQFSIYCGPKIYHALKKLGHDEDEIMNFGMFKVVSHFLLNSMNWLHSVLGSYAAAIIVLTLCIRGGMWPLQNRATASMRQMQALQPRMTELREKYKDDPTRMNEELMKLYKQYGVNPFGGCLPMVVQIPVFFGFYAMLGTAIELRNSKFLWVHDLSQPDTIFHLAGFPVNILPLCMAVTMFWQMSLSPKSGDAMQQRVMMFMPLIFIAFCYNFASALALYWTVQNLFSVVQLYITQKKTAPALVKVPPPGKRK